MASNQTTPFKIICSPIPLEFFNTKTITKQYFRQFGRIKRITFKKRHLMCVVEFYNHDSVINALRNAGEYNGQYFDVVTDDYQVEEQPKQSTPKRVKDPDPDWVDDPDVKAELEAMGGSSDVRKQYDLRPEKMMVDVPPVEQKVPKLKRIWKTADVVKLKKKKSDIQTKSISITPEQFELINVVKQPANTVEEKYRVLDARDKIIRLRSKNTNLKSSATVGTCPDMCPEKERLMRVTQHQVALYEQDENGRGMNYALAVKQYSRSSADQEAPLPHELRPVNVLQMTMSYLMHEIMNLCDGQFVNFTEWYHFLWDRTRGIRKDITQQELCCQGSVELVEQCARFHIHCSARLVAEDPSVFDQRINTENLTKCLQTLKYMYHDLQLKGELCKNEAEFRAYIILLNLNDGNFMWEVQQLRSDIQKSDSVKFALDVYSALDKNNYVKFFKLVNSTTYLNACILMRYFLQIRLSALKILLKCYSPHSQRATKTVFPLSELTRILAFEDNESTIDFIESHGLNLNSEKTGTILDRHLFVHPEFPYVLDRAINVVESKRNCSVGEVICGQKLPPKFYENHQPENSFDSRGCLIFNEYLKLSDLEMLKPPKKVTIKEEEEPVKKEIDTVEKNIFSQKKTDIFSGEKTSSNNAWIFGPSKTVPSKNIFAPQKSIFQVDQVDKSNSNSSSFWSKDSPNIFAQPIAVDTSKSIFGAPITQVKSSGGFSFPLEDKKQEEKTSENFEQELPKITDVSQQQQQLELEKKRKQKEEEKEKAAAAAAETLRLQQEQERKRLLEKIEEEKRLLEELRLYEKRKLEEIEQQRKKQIAADLEIKKKKEQALKLEQERENSVKELITQLIDDVSQLVRNEKLENIRKRIEKRIILKMITTWKLTIFKNKRKRKAIDCSPVWVGTKTLKEQACELHTNSQDVTLSLMKRYKRGVSFEIPTFDDDRIKKINLYELTYSSLLKRMFDLNCRLSKNIFWKVTISLPNETEMLNGLNRIEETLQDLFKWKHRNGETVLVEQIKPSPIQSVTYCINKQKGVEIFESSTNGIIFIADDFNCNLQHRILENLKNFGVFVKVPIVILLQNCDDNQNKLKTLMKQNIISDYIILIDQFTPHILQNLLEEALIFLAKNVEKPPPLQLDTMKSFITKHLCSEIWRRANSFTKWNYNYKQCLRNPNVVIKLFNEGLDRLKKIVLNENCLEFETFPAIFKEFLISEIPDYLPCNYRYFPKFWNEKSYRDSLESIFVQLELPSWREKWPPNNEMELEVNLSKFCTRIFKKPEKPFLKLMSIFLRNLDPTINFEDVNQVIWTDVVEVIANEKLNELNFSLTGTEFDNKSVFNQYVVVYDVNALEEYNNSDWFYINNPIVMNSIRKQLRDEIESKEETKKPTKEVDLDLSIDLDKTLSEVTNQLQDKNNIKKMRQELEEFNFLLSDLETSIKIHKKISNKFETTLKRAIEEET